MIIKVQKEIIDNNQTFKGQITTSIMINSRANKGISETINILK